MAELPFADDAFDLGVANVSIQNIKDRDRHRAIITGPCRWWYREDLFGSPTSSTHGTTEMSS
jgi:hypothetical protein